MYKLLIILLLSSCSPKIQSFEQEKKAANKKKEQYENFQIILMFMIGSYFIGKFMTYDYK